MHFFRHVDLDFYKVLAWVGGWMNLEGIMASLGHDDVILLQVAKDEGLNLWLKRDNLLSSRALHVTEG